MSDEEFKFKETLLSEQAWEAFCCKRVDLAKEKALEAIEKKSAYCYCHEVYVKIFKSRRRAW